MSDYAEQVFYIITNTYPDVCFFCNKKGTSNCRFHEIKSQLKNHIVRINEEHNGPMYGDDLKHDLVCFCKTIILGPKMVGKLPECIIRGVDRMVDHENDKKMCGSPQVKNGVFLEIDDCCDSATLESGPNKFEEYDSILFRDSDSMSFFAEDNGVSFGFDSIIGSETDTVNDYKSVDSNSFQTDSFQINSLVDCNLSLNSTGTSENEFI